MASVANGRVKCLLPFGEQTILDHQIDSLRQSGVDEIAIVVGHAKDQIIQHVGARYAQTIDQFEFVDNPRFEHTNNMYSLWRARTWLGESSFVCINGDTLCHPEIVKAAARADSNISVAIAREFREETTKVITDQASVVRLSKTVTREQHNATFVGVAKFSADGARQLFDRAEAMFADGQIQQHFNDVIDALVAEGVTVGYTESVDLPWAEVDDPADWQFANANVFPRLAAMLLADGPAAG